MRPLVLLLSLGFSTALHAFTSIRFQAEHTELTEGTTLVFLMENDGGETLVEPQVVIELDPGLEIHGAIRFRTGDWICGIVAGRQATCRLPAMGVGIPHSLSFDVRASRAGRFKVQATFNAKNLADSRQATIHVSSTQRIVVSSPADFGEGTLRAAIEAVNADPLCGSRTHCRISFGSPMTIAPAIPLPPIRKCNVEITGGAGVERQDQPKSVVISGENATWGNGLEVRASCAEGVPGVKLHSLVVHSWPWNGIYFEAPERHTSTHVINLSYIGTNAMGLEARPNRGRGVVTDSPHERLVIDNCVISGNARSGVALFRGERISLVDAKVGVNRYHQPLGNGASGIFTFGVPVGVGGGVIAHNAHAGVAIARGTTGAVTQGTRIHSNGGLPIDWGLDDRTLPDDDGDRIPNTPRITEAYYDAGINVTVVRGTVRLRRNAFGSNAYSVQSYIASSERGDVIEPLPLGNQDLEAPVGDEARDVDFEFGVFGDFRGKLIAVRLEVVMPPTLPLTSEISEAEVVR